MPLPGKIKLCVHCNMSSLYCMWESGMKLKVKTDRDSVRAATSSELYGGLWSVHLTAFSTDVGFFQWGHYEYLILLKIQSHSHRGSLLSLLSQRLQLMHCLIVTSWVILEEVFIEEINATGTLELKNITNLITWQSVIACLTLGGKKALNHQPPLLKIKEEI